MAELTQPMPRMERPSGSRRAPARMPLAVPTSVEMDELDATVRIGEPCPLIFGPQIPLDSIRDLGPYRLLEQLGSGGMGIVFEAEDRIVGGRFAVKVLRPTLIMDVEAKQRFFHEAQAMATIGHQRIVPIIRVGEDRGIPYIAMPLLLGETLEDRLHRAPNLTLDEIVRTGIEIAEGLEAAHQRGLIHRDVKPANVFLEEPFASIRLLDLGLAREITKDTVLTQNGVIMGTPAYMSPEQARGEKLDPRTDLFSLGCILYQMTTGIRPFSGPSPLNVLHQLETYHPPRVSARNPRISAMLSNIIMELLAKHPKDRPATAGDVMAHLRRIPLHEEPRSGLPIPDSKPFFDDRGLTNSGDGSEAVDAAVRSRGSSFPTTILLLLAICGSLWYFW